MRLFALASASGTSAGGIAGAIVIGVVLMALWLLPIAVAYHRRVRGIGMIVTVTLLLGWTLIGWVVALAMSFTSNVKPD